MATTQYSPGFGAAGGNREGLPGGPGKKRAVTNKGMDKHAVNDLRRQSRKGFKSHPIEGSPGEERGESPAKEKSEGGI